MRIKQSFLRDGLSIKEAKIINAMAFFGSYDANMKHIYNEVNRNHLKQGKKRISMRDIKSIVNRLLEIGILEEKIYKERVVHYKLKI